MVAELESELLEEFKNAIDLYPPTNSEEEMCRFFEHIYNILNDNREICVALVSENGDISFYPSGRNLCVGKDKENI